MSDLFHTTPIDKALGDLERDLGADDGPRISTMRNFRFAIVPYAPAQEFEMRTAVKRLAGRLRQKHWQVLSISLHGLLMKRIKAMDAEYRNSIIKREKRLFEGDPGRALGYLRDELAGFVDEARGIASDVSARVADFAHSEQVDPDRTVIFIGRAGALFPFFRSSALLKRLDGHTLNLPVVLLYPGERHANGLSFMGVLPPDGDYRPRIYT